MRHVTKIHGFLIMLAAAAMAGCSGDGKNLSSLRNPNGATPAPQVTTVTEYQTVRETVQVEVTREVPVEILATIEVPVEIVREVIVTATPDVQAFAQPTPRPTNGVRGYADASACDMRTPQPTPRTGDIDVLFGCTNAWETAVAYSHQPQGGK